MADIPPGYPYDDHNSATPYGGSAGSSFVISTTPETQSYNRKKWMILTIALVALLSFVVTLIVTQKQEPVADIRNYALDEGDGLPSGGFGGFVTTPAQILMDQPPSCLPGDTSPRCQTAQSSVQSVRITNTPTPTPKPKTVTQKVLSLFLPSPSPTPIPQLTNTPTPTHVPLPPIQTPTSTPVVTQATVTIQQTPTPTVESSSPTSTPLPVLSCQRVELFRGSENVTQQVARIMFGDSIRFIGYVSNVGRPVESITFRLTIDDEVKEEKKAPATLSDNMWVAQFEHNFVQYGRHRVTVVGITAKE